MASKIFINYRRGDSPGTAGRLHDRLAQTFGPDNSFIDVDNIPVGIDFVNYLNNQLEACDVFLAIIGPNWLNAKDQFGRRRLDAPEDFVRIEIAEALTRNICVIPVLVDGAPIPSVDELPDSIKPLARRNAVEVRNAHFRRDAEALVEKVHQVFNGQRALPGQRPSLASSAAWFKPQSRWRMAAGSATALLLISWIVFYQMDVPVWAMGSGRSAERDAPGVENTKAADDADARRMAAKAEQQRLTALWMEEERKKTAAELESRVKAELIDNERRVALRAEEERRAKAAAEAEARRKSEEAERQRLADLRTEGLVTTSRSGAAPEDEKAPTLLESSFVSTWAIETPLNCNLPSKSYSLKIEDGNIIWRDGTGNIDIETVVLSAETEFRTITLKSVHHNGRGEKSGTTWTYSSLGRDRLSVKPGGRDAFRLARCSS